MSEPTESSFDPLEILESISTGDGHSWAEEFKFLWSEDRQKMLTLLDSVLAEGIRNPVVIGADGRLHDGHHRVAIATALQLRSLPVLDFRP